MCVRTAVRLAVILFLSSCFSTASLHAGGPILFNEAGNEFGGAQPFSWLGNRAVYLVEQGNLSEVITNQDAAEAARRAFKHWTDVPMAQLQVVNLEDLPDGLSAREREIFKRDITAADFAPTQCTLAEIGTVSLSRLLCDMFTACVDHINQVIQGSRPPAELNCPSPVIFDEDGSITARAFPTGVGVLGFSAPVSFSAPNGSTQRFSIKQGVQLGTGLFVSGLTAEPLRLEPFRILQSFTVLNGAFFGQEAPFDDRLGNLEALMVHEFGHFLGLGHTNGPNGDSAALNPRPGEASVQPLPTPSPRTSTLGSVDGLAMIGFADVETMYPFFLSKESVTLEKDDQVSLSTLYPCSEAAIVAGRCKENFFATGTIAGRVFIPEATGGPAVPAQGVLVTARRLDADSSRGILKEAVSQFTGATFAPQRCWGPVFRDGDGDGILDNNGDGVPDPNNPQVFTGLLWACAVRDDPATPTIEEGRATCDQQIKNLDSQFLFDGRCGWLSSTLSDSRPTSASSEENRFALTGLAPGKYIVQAVPTFMGGFSSPVRTSFFTAAPVVHFDDNFTLALFPNPQTGEFYNGLSTGCDSNAIGCGNEQGDAADNPFAYTVIDLSAGGRIDNINIVLNTTTVRPEIFANPGFDFCRLGDVDGNSSVDQGDILAVGRAKAAFDQDPQSLGANRRADLNEDGSITFLDLDIITDLVSLPDPLDGSTSQELKRGIAPFEAICTAAKREGCRVQAPVKTLQADGTPSAEMCNTARSIGCQVIGCL